MNDFDKFLANNDFGFQQQGKPAPMAASKGSSSNLTSTSSRTSNHPHGMSSSDNSDSIFGSEVNNRKSQDGFADVFGGPPKYSRTSETRGSDSEFNYDSMLGGLSSNTGVAKSSNMPKYYKPVYDDDIFDGIPGLKSSSTVKYDDAVEPPASSRKENVAFDDLLGRLSGPGVKSHGLKVKGSQNVVKGAENFDDLIPGFGGTNPLIHSQTSEANRSSKSYVDATRASSTIIEEPFVVLGSASAPEVSSSRPFIDPLEDYVKFGKPKPGPLSSIHSNATTNRSSVRSPDTLSESETTRPTFSDNSHDSFSKSGSHPSYAYPRNTTVNSQVDISPTSEESQEIVDDVWLTVSEIPLFTQPTSAPPPSRPPPPRPAKVSKPETDSFVSSTATEKTNNNFTSVTNSTQYFAEFEDFTMGRNDKTNKNDRVNVYPPGKDFEANSDAAASAAAMKEAMDRAEAKFKHAKEVRERENAKNARSTREAVIDLDKEGKDSERMQRREKEQLNEERRIAEEKERNREVEREMEERGQRRLERQRERAREAERARERAKQAVERAIKESRDRAVAEAQIRAEKAAVEKVNAEARLRAERNAVQRVQAEARERAAAEAKERAEKAAAEAKEKANSEARERAAKAELDARSRSERAAVDKANAEARQRAATQARERAAAANVKVNQQNNQDDLESFFGVGTRPSSVPKERTSASDPLFDTQFQATKGPEVPRRTSVGTSSNSRKTSSTTNITDDLSSIFGAAPSPGGFQEIDNETEERRRARLERHQRTQERAANALAEKNKRDLQVQMDQAERHRISETLDAEIKRWSAGKEGNLRALLSTLQYVLWPECGWQPVSLTDLITAASVKKVYRKATLCIHPDKVQQKGANLQQKYVAEKVFDLLKEAWNKLNSEELF